MKAVVKKQQTVDALVESFKGATARPSLLRVSSTTL